MKRDWDKLHRYDRARPPGPIDSFKPKPLSRHHKARTYQKARKKWLSNLQRLSTAAPSCLTARNTQQDEDRLKPAEAYPLSQGSPASADNTTTSKNNDTSSDQPASNGSSIHQQRVPGAGVERLNHAPPLNMPRTLSTREDEIRARDCC